MIYWRWLVVRYFGFAETRELLAFSHSHSECRV
jgi:hypothetical protein